MRFREACSPLGESQRLVAATATARAATIFIVTTAGVIQKPVHRFHLLSFYWK